MYYNNTEFCVTPPYVSSGSAMTLAGYSAEAGNMLMEDLKASIKDQLNITPSCTAPEQYSIGYSIIKCTFGGKTCGYRVAIQCVSYQGVGGCGWQIEAFCGKCLYNSCGSSNIG